jgi:hypothetical protein
MSLWVRAFVMCDDVRLELGGTVSLIGVYADRITVAPGDGDIVLGRLAIYTIVAGLTGVRELAWRTSLILDGSAPGAPLMETHEVHDARYDEHRIVSMVSPIALHEGRYRLELEIEAMDVKRTLAYRFLVERARPAVP